MYTLNIARHSATGRITYLQNYVDALKGSDSWDIDLRVKGIGQIHLI